MNEPPQPEPEPARYIRLPLPVVAGGLLVVLAGLLALGLYANRNLRQPAVLLPTPTAAPVAAATALPTVGPTAAAPPAPTLVPTPLILVIAATPTPAAPPGTLEPTPGAQLSPATASPTPLPTVEPALAAEVGKAYENFWRVSSQALLELDSAHLTEVMDGDYLATVSQRITELRGEGRAIKANVLLNYSVIAATTDVASVLDDFEDDSVYVRIGTEDPLTDPAMDRLRVLYKLRNYSGLWKVVDSVRSE